MKKSDRYTNTRHSRESGNLLRRFRKKNRADIADGRLRIPAFAGMTKYYSMGIVFSMPILRRTGRHNESRPISSHARKRESIAVFYKGKRDDIVHDHLWIPAFERVKKSDRYTNTRHSRESGNLLRRWVLSFQCRYFGGPSVAMRAARLLHTLSCGRREGSIRRPTPRGYARRRRRPRNRCRY